MRTALIIASGVLAVLLAGCATTQGSASGSADGLEHDVEALTAEYCAQGSPVCSAAQEFAQATREFRRTLDTAGDAEIVSSYKRLWRGYQTLRGEFYASADRQLRADFKPTTRAFIDVQRNVRNRYSYADPALYANGAYFLDPYYN